jgi:hypothetical protein
MASEMTRTIHYYVYCCSQAAPDWVIVIGGRYYCFRIVKGVLIQYIFFINYSRRNFLAVRYLSGYNKVTLEKAVL